MPGTAPDQGQKKAFFLGNLEITEGRFFEICLAKIVKNNDFQRQETLFEKRSSPVSLLRRSEANKSGSHKLQIRNHVFYQCKDDILVGQGASARTP